MDQLNLRAWEGRTELTFGGVSTQQAAMIAAALDTHNAHAVLERGDLPALWHWCAFPPIVPTADLALDGHPALGAFLPPVKLNRRMWASGEVTFRSSVEVDDPLERRSSIRAISEKSGSTGPMVFVTVDHAIYGPRGLAIEEQQNIVYLNIPEVYTPPQKRPMPSDAVISDKVDVNSALLFRYSALTFNAHRVHYDLPYTQKVEKYPHLVVHGPLQATLLIDFATRRRGRAPRKFSYRGVHPMFADAALDLCAVEDGQDLELFAGQSGHQGMQATAIWEDGS